MAVLFFRPDHPALRCSLTADVMHKYTKVGGDGNGVPGHKPNWYGESSDWSECLIVNTNASAPKAWTGLLLWKTWIFFIEIPRVLINLLKR